MPGWLTRLGTALVACLSTTGVFAADAAWNTCFQHRSNTDQKIAACSKLLLRANRDESKLSIIYERRAGAYFGNSEYEKSISDYNQLIIMEPTYAAAFSNRAGAYFAKGNYGQAITDYSEAIRLDPDYPLTYIMRGKAHEKAGNL